MISRRDFLGTFALGATAFTMGVTGHQILSAIPAFLKNAEGITNKSDLAKEVIDIITAKVDEGLAMNEDLLKMGSKNAAAFKDELQTTAKYEFSADSSVMNYVLLTLQNKTKQYLSRLKLEQIPDEPFLFTEENILPEGLYQLKFSVKPSTLLCASHPELASIDTPYINISYIDQQFIDNEMFGQSGKVGSKVGFQDFKGGQWQNYVRSPEFNAASVQIETMRKVCGKVNAKDCPVPVGEEGLVQEETKFPVELSTSYSINSDTDAEGKSIVNLARTNRYFVKGKCVLEILSTREGKTNVIYNGVSIEKLDDPSKVFANANTFLRAMDAVESETVRNDVMALALTNY